MGSARESRGRPPFLLSRGAFFLTPTPRPSSRRPRGSTDPSSLSFSRHARVTSLCDSVDRLPRVYDHHRFVSSSLSRSLSFFFFNFPLLFFFFFSASSQRETVDIFLVRMCTCTWSIRGNTRGFAGRYRIAGLIKD